VSELDRHPLSPEALVDALQDRVAPASGKLISSRAVLLPAWDQSDGMWCDNHQEDMTLCSCSDQEYVK
jgi:hypothetical protein